MTKSERASYMVEYNKKPYVREARQQQQRIYDEQNPRTEYHRGYTRQSSKPTTWQSLIRGTLRGLNRIKGIFG
jgi:hypothetical protein|tara:strand:- start:49 stop:267 length:219 start_codon:yes stop_codon:yes gene_type:complete